MAVDDALQIDLANALERADEEGVHRHKTTGIRGFDVAFAELGAEPLQQADLLVRQLDLALCGRLLQAQKAVMFGQEAVALPDAAYTAGRDL